MVCDVCKKEVDCGWKKPYGDFLCKEREIKSETPSKFFVTALKERNNEKKI